MKYIPLDTAASGRTGYQQQVKEANIKQIFDLVRDRKCKSRAELVRHMNLSATSVSVLVEELASRGLIDETGPTQTSLPGRRPISLRLNSGAHQLVTFSLRSNGVRYVLLDMACKILERRFFPLDMSQLTDDSAGEALSALFVDILRRKSRQFDSSRALMVGISLSGIYLKGSNTFNLEASLGFSLPEEALRRFQSAIKLPICVMNASRSMAYAEKKVLDAASPDQPATTDMLFVGIRNRIACAILSGGNIFTGPYDVAGEIGHISIDYRGRPCRCGNMGCLERYASLDAILEDARVACRETGIKEPETLEELARRYPGEPVLMNAVTQSARLLAFGLYSVLCASGMRHIVLGGGIEALGSLFLQEVQRALQARSLLIRSLDLSYTQAGEDAECVGIAQYFLDKVYTITM